MPLKTRVKRVLARRNLPRGSCDSRVVVLCYHSVHPSKAFASASPELFATHLEWLKQHCDLISFRDAARAAKDRCGTRSRPAVALTFDDGYADNYEYGFPLLDLHRIPATIFLTVGLIERELSVIQFFRAARGCDLDEIQPLTWSQINEMQASGLEVGTHTFSHRNLMKLSRSNATTEMTRARSILQSRLSTAADLMAYPYGKRGRHYSRETVAIAAEAGFSYAAASMARGVSATDSHLEVPRFFVTNDDLGTLSAKVRGSLDFLGRWHERAPKWVSRVVSPEDFRF